MSGKTTPPDVSRKLVGLAEGIERALKQAGAKVMNPKSAVWRSTELDLGVLAQLARYHAAKTWAVTHMAFYQLTGEKARLSEALFAMRDAASAWQRIVDRTDGVYHANLVFGIGRDSPRSRLGQHHTGHWKDRLAELRNEVLYLDVLSHRAGGARDKFRTFPGEVQPAAVPQVEHEPILTARPGADLTVTARVRSQAPLRKVLLHHRPLDQTADWKRLQMRPAGDDRFEAKIPGQDVSARWDLQYYFEVLTDEGGRLWPSWEEGTPYLVLRVGRPRS
jgi:hypothetical protein